MSVESRTAADGTRSYRVRWREDGRNRSRAFPALRDARLWDAEVTRRKRLGTLASLDGGARTLDDFVADAWAPERHAGLAASTRRFYANLYSAHIAPEFARTPLRDITAPRVAAWRAARLRAGGGSKAVREAHSLLGGMLGYAVELGELHFNAARAVRPAKRPPRKPVRAWSARQLEAIRSGMGVADAVLVAVLAYAGLRPSEAVAVQWRDVQERTLLIERAAELDTSGVKGTKTDAVRAVRLLAPLAQDLTEWRLRCGRPGPTTPMFPLSDGRPWRKHDWDNWRRRVWTPALAASGLD